MSMIGWQGTSLVNEVRMGGTTPVYLKHFVSLLLHHPGPYHMAVFGVLLLESFDHVLQLNNLLADQCLQRRRRRRSKMFASTLLSLHWLLELCSHSAVHW